MADKPILFSGEMVRAILDGRKTVTRRVAKQFSGQPERWRLEGDMMAFDGGFEYAHLRCPYGRPGDLLWVRETWRPFTANGSVDAAVQYKADSAIEQVFMTPDYINRFPESPDKWRPSIHMPRWASRILLEVVSRRLERLQDISEADCIAEGAPGGHGVIPGYAYAATPLEHYRHIWTEINGQASWDANPWVWVVEFKPQPNGD